MKGLTAIILVVVIIGIILAVYLGKRSSAKKLLLISMPKKKRSEEWKTSQKNALVNFLILSLNELQRLEDEILYCERVIEWRADRIKAFTFLRKKDEVIKENEANKLSCEEISKLKKEKQTLLFQFEDSIPKTKDKTIASIEDLDNFSNATSGVISTLLHNPKCCKTNNGCSLFLCANFYVMQNNHHVTIEPYHNVLVKETYELQNIGYSVNPSRDDEVARVRYLHERKNGGPDRRYSYNPSAYVVYRGIINITFNGVGCAPIKFSNRRKSHSCFVVLNGLIERASSVMNKRIFSKMLSMDKLCSATEISKIIEEEEAVENERKKKIEQEEQERQLIIRQRKIEEQNRFEEQKKLESERERKLEEELCNDEITKEKKVMGTQPVWNQYEAALLLEGCLQVKKGENKHQVVARISKDLRQMAIKKGQTIDEIYRNENGITLQMVRMQMAMAGVIDEKRKPAKIFFDIVSMYKSDRNSFNELLKQAKVMCMNEEEGYDDLVVKVEFPSQDVIDENAKKVDHQTTQQPEENKIKIYDYQTSTNLSFTKPVLVMYFGEIDSKVQTWREVYCAVLHSLWEDYPTIIKELAEKSDFTTVSYNKQTLRHAMQVTPSLFAEGNRSASELGRAIRQLLDLCNVDYENVVIRYVATNKDDVGGALKEIVKQNTEESQDSLQKIEAPSKFDNEIYEVIKLKYLNGFLSGAINFKKMRRFYAEMFSKELDVENIAIEESLRKMCLYLDGKYYAIDSLMDDELKYKVAGYVQECVESNGYVYYKMIVDNFGYELTEHIPNLDLLKKYLCKAFPQYAYFDEYLARDKEVVINVTKEVEQVLLDAVYPISFEKIRAMLPYLTEEAIKKVVLFDNNIICTNNNDRFHIDSMGLSDEDVKRISDIISDALKEHNCMFGNELLKGIQNKMPSLYEGVKEFGDRGIRSAIAYKLKNQFRFNSNIICEIGANIDNAEVFKSFAEEERYFSLAALVNLKEQIGVGSVYFDSVNEVASRINANDYVPNVALSFNEEAIDEVLERIIAENQASIKEASNFAIYPSTCYPWTEYLLESYIAKFSKKFKLIHICYAESKCAGAIVKRTSHIDSMDAVVIEYLVNHEDIQTGDEALNGLVEDGYIARKRYKNIEDLLVVAKSKRRA